jgi:hypothetical protein
MPDWLASSPKQTGKSTIQKKFAFKAQFRSIAKPLLKMQATLPFSQTKLHGSWKSLCLKLHWGWKSLCLWILRGASSIPLIWAYVAMFIIPVYYGTLSFVWWVVVVVVVHYVNGNCNCMVLLPCKVLWRMLLGTCFFCSPPSPPFLIFSFLRTFSFLVMHCSCTQTTMISHYWDVGERGGGLIWCWWIATPFPFFDNVS